MSDEKKLLFEFTLIQKAVVRFQGCEAKIQVAWPQYKECCKEEKIQIERYCCIYRTQMLPAPGSASRRWWDQHCEDVARFCKMTERAPETADPHSELSFACAIFERIPE